MANWAPANWAPADWAPANRAPADWAPWRQIGPLEILLRQIGPQQIGLWQIGSLNNLDAENCIYLIQTYPYWGNIVEFISWYWIYSANNWGIYVS